MTTAGEYEAAWNAVAVASVAYTQERARFRYVLRLAHQHGLSLEELVEASGWDETSVLRALEEID